MTAQDFSVLMTSANDNTRTIARKKFGSGYYQLINIPIVFHVLVNHTSTANGTNYPTLTENQMYFTMNYTNSVFNVYDRISKQSFQFINFTSEPLVINTNFTAKKECYNFNDTDFRSIVTTVPEWEYKIHAIICVSDVVGGYATFPNSYPANDPRHNAIAIDYTQVSCYRRTGRYKCSPNPTNLLLKSATVPHELGHLFGLYHTFQGGCSDRTGGDMVSDTPYETDNYTTSQSGCPGLLPYNKNRNLFAYFQRNRVNQYKSASEQCLETCPRKTCASCENVTCCASHKPFDSCPRQPGIDPRTNIMTYSPPVCSQEFTPGQLSRMVALTRYYKTYIYCNYVNVKDPDKCTGIPCASTASSPNCI